MMVIVSLGQGLGNQMFQYAFSCALHKLHPNIEIKFDTKYAFEIAHNGVEINRIFDVKLNVASLDEIKLLTDRKIIGLKDPLIKKISRAFRRRLGLQKKSFIRQKDFTEFKPIFFNIDPFKSYYMFGVFCNSGFFESAEDIIRKQFIFPELDEANMKWENIINENRCISLHIRRGDYITEGLDILSTKYYKDAIDIISGKYPETKFTYLIFSDDNEFTKLNFNWLDNSYIVCDNSGENSFRDMQLMSMCEHNVIANSTFSFWGAYLNQNPQKIVVAPKKPLRNCKNTFAMKDWILI